MADPPANRQSSFQAALENLTDGVTTLVTQHFELARYELRMEASEVGRNVGILAITLAIGLLGYALLHVGIILTVGWLFGIGPMALTALAIGLIHLIVAGVAASRALKRLSDDEQRLPETTEELQRNRQWLTEMRDNSSPGLPAETS